MESLGRICVFDDDAFLTAWAESRLSRYGYDVFAKSNLYQFFLYAREMQPHLLVMNIEKNRLGCRMFWDMLYDDNILQGVPVVVMVSSNHPPEKHKCISHVLSLPLSVDGLMEIAEAYCVGHKDHDVLLIDDYMSQAGSALDVLQRQSLSCFEVHNLEAAQQYLQKNFPRGICVCLPYEQCRQVEAGLTYSKIFYVENPARLKNIATLLN